MKNITGMMLMDVAKILFSEYGFQGTRIEMITEACSLSPAFFYRYVSNKQEICRQLTLQGLKLLGERIAAALVKPYDSAKSRLMVVTPAYVEFLRKRRDTTISWKCSTEARVISVWRIFFRRKWKVVLLLSSTLFLILSSRGCQHESLKSVIPGKLLFLPVWSSQSFLKRCYIWFLRE
jgi:AcrR family transcriptional regulator